MFHYLFSMLEDLVAVFGIEFYDITRQTRESKGLKKVNFGLDLPCVLGSCELLSNIYAWYLS